MTGRLPDRSAEQRFRGRVAGVDEVGRGPLCGPVVAAAVILPGPPVELRPKAFEMVRDSKALSAGKREVLASMIVQDCAVGIGVVEAHEIDSMGILQATFLAMRKAIGLLPTDLEHVLVDGNLLPKGLPCAGTAIVKGDATCLAIAAASIVAKQHRDAIMKDLAREHPQYGWERNSGYGTAEHRDAIRLHGPTPHHRRSFNWGLAEEPVQFDLFGQGR